MKGGLWIVLHTGWQSELNQGGTCLGNGSSVTTNRFAISFSTCLAVIPKAMQISHYIDYLNLSSKWNTGFSITGAFNGNNWQNTSGIYIAIGYYQGRFSIGSGTNNWPIAFSHACLVGQYSRTNDIGTDWGFANFNRTNFQITSEGSTASNRTSSVLGIGY